MKNPRRKFNYFTKEEGSEPKHEVIVVMAKLFFERELALLVALQGESIFWFRTYNYYCFETLVTIALFLQ